MSIAAKHRLSWIENARQGLLGALGEDVMSPTVEVRHTIDPLKFILTITLLHPLAKGSREPVRVYLRGWAEMLDCHLPVINITDKLIRAEVLTEHRFTRKNVEPGDEDGK